MTLILSGDITLRRTWQPMDPDAAAYITAVETADGQALEEKVKIAIDNFVLGCKADGIWDAIKASCILAGARTLNGALVPLAGIAPTNFNFVAGDYNRKTGLVGDGSTKYLDSSRNNNADPQDSNHNAVYVTAAESSAVRAYMGASFLTNEVGDNNFGRSGPNIFCRNRNTLGISVTGAGAATGLIGTNRFMAASYITRALGVNNTIFNTSQVPFNGNISIFASGGNFSTNARFAFYSIGESLDLALLDTRVTDLITAFGAAIP